MKWECEREWTSLQSVGQNRITITFIVNTKSEKGKSTEIIMVTQDHGMTETHLDDSIESGTVIETAGFDFFAWIGH